MVEIRLGWVGLFGLEAILVLVLTVLELAVLHRCFQSRPILHCSHRLQVVEL
jgi:hypothetical protein